jgi:hypothetical protein
LVILGASILTPRFMPDAGNTVFAEVANGQSPGKSLRRIADPALTQSFSAEASEAAE